MAGARENTTPVIHRIPPFRPGSPKPGARGPHGAKWIPLGRRLHDRVIPPSSFPSVLPIQAVRLGALLVLGLPFEITVEAGRRIEAAVRDAVGPGIERVAVSSLANEQFCYLTTPAEYALQRYEGGNTLYGPQSQPFTAALAARLARDVVATGRVADQLPSRRFDFAARRYLARPDGRVVAPAADGPVTFADPTATEDGYWEFRWHDAAPGDLRWHEPIARVDAGAPDGEWSAARHDGRPIDDQGYHVGVVHLGTDRTGRHRYAARWYTAYTGPAQPHRIAVVGSSGRSLISDPFA